MPHDDGRIWVSIRKKQNQPVLRPSVVTILMRRPRQMLYALAHTRRTIFHVRRRIPAGVSIGKKTRLGVGPLDLGRSTYHALGSSPRSPRRQSPAARGAAWSGGAPPSPVPALRVARHCACPQEIRMNQKERAPRWSPSCVLSRLLYGTKTKVKSRVASAVYPSRTPVERTPQGHPSSGY